MTDHHLQISSYAGLVGGARHYRGRVRAEAPKSCHGGLIFNGEGYRCAEGHPLPDRADWDVEDSWTEERYERWHAASFEGDGPGQFLDQKRLIEVAVGRFTDTLPARWWEEKHEPGKPGDRLILGSGIYDPDDEDTPSPDGVHRWGSILIEIPLREVPVPRRGSGPVRCDVPACRGHRERCLFGEMHSWSTWFENGRLQRTRDTYHCHRCGGVCIAEEEA